jgi:dienelactone hydrolase
MRWTGLFILGILLMVTNNLRAIEPDHRRLDWFADADGSIKPIQTPADWAKRRAAILSAMQEVMGPLPDRSHLPPIDVETRESVSRDGYRRETISFSNLYDEKVTAYLYAPENIPTGSRRTAVLALQPTGEAGKVIVDGALPDRPHRGYAAELARRGYIVIAPDYPSFGEQKDYGFKSSKYASGTMKAISDNMRCIDLLQARSDVDPKRIVAIGHSLGGHNALFTAAFDERIAVTITSCGWTPFHHYYGGKKLVNWAQDRYMPRVRDEYQSNPDKMPFDFAEVIGAIAPRAVFSNSPLHDENFDVEGVRLAVEPIQSIYHLLGADGRFVVRYPDCAHDFPDDVRHESYWFAESILGSDGVKR